MRLVTSLQRIPHIIMVDFRIDVGRILSNCANLLVAQPILVMCIVTDTDATNSIHVQTVGLVIFGSNQLCRFLVDGADIWKHYDLGDLVVGAGRGGTSKECNCSIHDHGMV